MFSISDCHFVKKWNLLERPAFEKFGIKHQKKDYVLEQDALMVSLETILKYLHKNKAKIKM